VNEEKGAQLYLVVRTPSQTQLHLMVGTQLLLLCLSLQASPSPRPFTKVLNKMTGCLFPCLLGVADALPGMAKAI
jgi:hypothetical protein